MLLTQIKRRHRYYEFKKLHVVRHCKTATPLPLVLKALTLCNLTFLNYADKPG